MAHTEFYAFIGRLGLRESTSEKLWAGNIRSPQELASSKTFKVSEIVDDQILINTILPVLQKYAFPITMAKDPYEKAISLLRREAGESSDKPAKASLRTSSDTLGFVDDSIRQETTTDPTNNISSTVPAFPQAMDDQSDLPRSNGEGRVINVTKEVSRGLFGDVKHTTNYGTTANLQITGGSFVQSPILPSKPVTYHNVNTTISATTFEDTKEAKILRRQQKIATSPLLIQGTTYSTSDLHFSDDSDFWLNDTRVQTSDQRDYQRHLVDDSVYPVQNWGQSRALIINNIQFDGDVSDRAGADTDGNNLKSVLEQLGFKVQLHENKRKDEINQLLREFTTSSENYAAPMTFVFIGSHGERHGEKDHFIGVDNDRVSIEELCDYFSAVNCTSLARKPKLFFFQFCRTARKETASDAMVEVQDQNVSNGMDWLPSSTEADAGPIGDEQPLPKAQSMADMLWSFATAPGTKAYRDTVDGSWFVTALCRVLKDHAHNDDLLSMLTKVNNSVSIKEGNENNEQAVQMTEFRATLRQKVMFFPQTHNNS